jgi:DNA segregation ATPase FtsK/SpoIIIE, S-DNA-T family
MTKDNEKRDWVAILTNPLLQQILALLVIAMGAITLLAVFQVTTGIWTNTWVERLRYWLGWGAFLLALAIVLAGLLWLQHQLDRSTTWRWRPFVGAELVFFSLLALTHFIVGKDDLWGLVEFGRTAKFSPSGGLVGWAISKLLLEYVGGPATLVALLIFLALGLGLTFDMTSADVKRLAGSVLEAFAERAERRSAEPAARSDPPPARPKPTQKPASTPPRAAPPPREQIDRERISPSERKRAPSIPIKARAEPAAATPPSTRSGAHSVPRPREVADFHRAAPPGTFSRPPLSLLNDTEGPALSDTEIRQKSYTIKKTLAQFGLPVEVVEVRVGPAVTQFGIEPGFLDSSPEGGRKVRVSQITSRTDDLALALATPRLRIEAPVPGRPYIGIEVPNSTIQLVGLREVMESETFRKLNSPLAFALGHNVAGDPVAADLARMPHLLIAGTTGSGKSICIKAITTCLIFTNTLEQLRLVMIDPKMVELVRFNGLPHLYGNVEVDLERVVKVLRWVALEMDDRYRRFADASARHLDDYNNEMTKKNEPTLPRLVVLIDELADLMMLAPDAVERLLCRIAQMGRATGIHLIVATQRPSTDVVTGLIKANFPARISFATAGQMDSRVILDTPGAETLLGAGDMLYVAADASHPVRVQGCFVSEEEVDCVVEFWSKQVGPVEERAPWERVAPPEGYDAIEEDAGEEDEDAELLQEAIDLVQEEGEASASLLQRKLHIGHPRAARLMQILEDMGVIGPPETAGRTRAVIIGGEGDYD